jgi:hypothetical protein
MSRGRKLLKASGGSGNPRTTVFAAAKDALSSRFIGARGGSMKSNPSIASKGAS